MTRHAKLVTVWLALLAMASTVPRAHVSADEALEQQASWAQPGADEIKAQMDAFLQTRSLDEPTRTALAAQWADDVIRQQSAEELLERVADTLSLVDEQVRPLVEFCRTTADVAALPSFPFLQDASQPEFPRHQLRLLYGRWLAQHRYYDECVEQLQGLTTQDVVDPAALLFYQSVAHYRTPDKRQCLPLVQKLLERQQQIPRRYVTVAQLMQADLAPLEVDSLDEIARLMDEVARRLELRRAGTRVRQQEDEVIAKLDKLIKKVEDQQEQQSAANAANLQPSRPAQDSLPAGGKGPGSLDPRQIGTKSGWGNLPPAERQEALQQIGKDLPAHYREVIEEYFRKLAREESGQ